MWPFGPFTLISTHFILRLLAESCRPSRMKWGRMNTGSNRNRPTTVHFERDQMAIYSEAKPVRVPKIVTYGSPCDQNPGCARTNGARITADKFKQFWVSGLVILGQYKIMESPSLVQFSKTPLARLVKESVPGSLADQTVGIF